MLTPHHLNLLRQDLRTLAHIEYEEVENELLDHYATLTEQKMETGQVFEYASANAWAELGEGIGLQQIQEEYRSKITKKIRDRYWQIIAANFRWPTILIILLIGCSLFYYTTLFAEKYIFLSFFIFITAPALTYLTVWFKDMFLFLTKRRHCKKTVKGEAVGRAMWILYIFNQVVINFPKTYYILLDQESIQPLTLLTINSLFTSVILTLGLVFSLSYFKLYFENFQYRTTGL
jgi:hypothetical protein